MAAPRRSTRPQQQPLPPWAPAALALSGVPLAAAVLYFGFPGAILAWLCVAMAAWSAQPPAMTGKKDATGFPTPAHAGEARQMRKYRFWADLKWRLVFPAAAFVPGWPPYVSWFAGLWTAAALWCLPHARVDGIGDLVRLPDALFGFILVTQVAAARRRTVVAGDTSPGVRLNAVKQIRGADRTRVALATLAGLVGALIGGLTLRLLPNPPVPVLAPIVWPFLGVIGGFAAGIARWWIDASLSHWRLVVAAREEWRPAWEILKHDPAPRLTDRQTVGPATVDSFDAPANLGAVAYWDLAPKMAAVVGAGRRATVLSVSSTDSQGQPVPGTKHPLKFQVVSWPDSALPNVLDPSLDPAVAALAIQTAMSWVSDGAGYGRGILDQAHPIALTDAPAAMAGASATADQEADAEGEASGAPEVSTSQAWATTWFHPDGPRMKDIRKMYMGDIANVLQAEVLIDHRNEVLYIGDLTSGNAVFDPSSGVTQEDLDKLATEDTWNGRWAGVLKQDVNPPTIEHGTYAEARLANGKTVYRQAFVTLIGVDPMEFQNLEGKIAATLNAAPFCAVTGWLSNGRVGERHAQAFTVYWSHDAVPANPDTLPPAGARDEAAARWVLAGRINEAFKAARLAKPEVHRVECLTQPKARGHIWKIAVRLYGGVTLGDVRTASQRLRQHLGSEWLRVEEDKDGCTIVAGVSPSKARLVDPKDSRYLAHLDWQQAWLDTKVSGVGGLTPNLVGTDVLPRNEQVQVLDFQLPSGLSVGDVKAAAKKLETATNNAYIDVRESPDGKADRVRILVSEVNPLPERVPFQFDVVDEIEGIPFATGVEGEPVVFDPASSPHALLAGVTGAGKSVLAQAFLYGFLAHGAEVYVIDPIKGGADFQFAKPYSKAFADDPFQAAGVMKAIYAEVVRRKNLNAQHGVGSYLDLPHPPLPIVVMIDEFTSLMGQSPVPKPSENPEVEKERALLIADNQARTEIGVIAGKLAREARSAGVTLLLGTQKLTAKMLDSIPGGQDLKTNLARVLLGKASYGDRASALRAFDTAPMLEGNIPKGRGLWESLTASAIVMQTWYAPQEDLGRNLGLRIAPLPEEAILDVTQFGPPELEVDGEVITDGFLGGRPPGASATGVETPVVEDLGEIEFSLDDLDLDLDAVDADDAPGGEPDPLVPADDLPEWSEEEVPLDGVAVDEEVNWGEIDPSGWAPADGGVFGWDEIDALLGFLADFPQVRRIVWSDSRLDDEDDMGITYRDIVSDLLAARDVSLNSPTPPAPLAPAGDPQDEFLPLPKVALHLLPDDDDAFA